MGPVSVMVGMAVVLLLWHEVQVDPLFPENPEIPPGLACAAVGRIVKTNVTSAIRLMTRACTGPIAELPEVRKAVANVELQALRLSRDFLSSTVASFLQPPLASTRAVGDDGMQLSGSCLL